MSATRVTTVTLREMKDRGEKISMLTAYDYPIARLLDEVGIEVVLVGDSLAPATCHPERRASGVVDALRAPERHKEWMTSRHVWEVFLFSDDRRPKTDDRKDRLVPRTVIGRRYTVIESRGGIDRVSNASNDGHLAGDEGSRRKDQYAHRVRLSHRPAAR